MSVRWALHNRNRVRVVALPQRLRAGSTTITSVTTEHRGAPAKARPWDVLQINEVDVADIISTLREIGEDLAQQMTRLKDEQLAKTFHGGDEKQRLRAALRVTGAAVADLEYWSRVLVEFASRAGTPQREIATALGISTNTVNRWVREPIGWNRSDDTTSSVAGR